jgi:predicted Zn-dependent protease
MWHLKKPDRFPYQRIVEQMASNVLPNVKDFSGWTPERFRRELLRAAKKEGPHAVYGVKTLFDRVDSGKGQWEINPYLVWFQEALLPLRSEDIRTMYVGITEADIYSGETNYLFSQYRVWDASPASILSYGRMLAESTGESQSQERLIGRIAKELVPASLKTLGIPRSIEPTCPYSYANGIQRVDQKTFELSKSVQDAIWNYRARAHR